VQIVIVPYEAHYEQHVMFVVGDAAAAVADVAVAATVVAVAAAVVIVVAVVVEVEEYEESLSLCKWSF
jgi:energy-converting hydrogenase Eha subunit C